LKTFFISISKFPFNAVKTFCYRNFANIKLQIFKNTEMEDK